MSNHHKDDIKIGNDERILFEDIQGKQSTAVNIDSFIEQMNELWSRLETECMAECCGFDAFNFMPENIQQATRGCNIAATEQIIISLINYIKQSPSDIFVSTRLNQYFHRNVILQLLDHIQKNIARVEMQP